MGANPDQVYAGLVLRPAASWYQRVAATWLDLLVVGLPGLALMVAGASTGEPRYPGDDPQMTPAGIVLAWTGIVVYLAIWSWNRYVRAARTGQSLGKTWMRVRVVDADGVTAPAGRRLVLRDGAHVLDLAPAFLGFFWAAWDGRGQTFADKLLGTTVRQA